MNNNIANLKSLKIKKENFPNFNGTFTISRMVDVKFKFNKFIYDIVNSYEDLKKYFKNSITLDTFSSYNKTFLNLITKLSNEKNLNTIPNQLVYLAINPYEFYTQSINYDNYNHTIYQYEFIDNNDIDTTFLTNPNVKIILSDGVLKNIYFDVIYLYKIILNTFAVFVKHLTTEVEKLSSINKISAYTILNDKTVYDKYSVMFLKLLSKFNKFMIDLENFNDEEKEDFILKDFKIYNLYHFITSNVNINSYKKLEQFINSNENVDITTFVNFEIIPEFLLVEDVIKSNSISYIWILALRICTKSLYNVNKLTNYVNKVLKNFDNNNYNSNPIYKNINNFITHHIVNDKNYNNNNSLVTKVLNMTIQYNNLPSRVLQFLNFPFKQKIPEIVNYKINSITNSENFDIFQYQSINLYILFDEGDNFLFDIYDLIVEKHMNYDLINATVLLNFILQLFLGLLSMLIIFNIVNEEEISFQSFAIEKTNIFDHTYFMIEQNDNQFINISVPTMHKLKFVYYGMMNLERCNKENLKKEYRENNVKFWNDRVVKIFTMILLMINKLLNNNNIHDLNNLNVFSENVADDKTKLLKVLGFMASILEKNLIQQYHLEKFYSYDSSLLTNNNHLSNFLANFYSDNIVNDLNSVKDFHKIFLIL